jgi:hypothetical protein
VHLVNLVGDEPMGLAMYSLGGLFIRSLNQAEDRAAALVEPVLLIVDAVLILGRQVPLVCLRDGV